MQACWDGSSALNVLWSARAASVVGGNADGVGGTAAAMGNSKFVIKLQPSLSCERAVRGARVRGGMWVRQLPPRSSDSRPAGIVRYVSSV